MGGRGLPDIGAPDLVECAELGVTELVTNALLHGEPPIHMWLRGTHEHPRVEVHDGSTEPPVLPGRRRWPTSTSAVTTTSC